jgi:hypothetical protein
MASERTTYLYYPLTLHTDLIKHNESFPIEVMFNSRKDERSDFIIFNKLIKATDAIFR